MSAVEETGRVPKPKKFGLNAEKGAFPAIVTSELVIEPYEEEKIVNSLVKETGLAKKTAVRIARETRDFLRNNNITQADTTLIREVVNTLLLKHGLPEHRNKYQRIGLPAYDIEQLIRESTRENANLQHQPETIHKLIADSVVRQYTLTRVLTPELSHAHLTGEIHIHNLEYWPIRPYCASHDLRYLFKHGLRTDGTGKYSPVAKPAKNPETAVLHTAKFLAAMQTEFAGAQGADFFNVWLAPYVRGLEYQRIKQLMQAFIFEMSTMPAARGGQVVFSDINLELGVPDIAKRVDAIGPGGQIAGKYGEYENEAQSLFKALMEVYLEGDAQGKPFFFPKPSIKLRKESIDAATYEENLLLAHRLASKYGTPYFLNLIPGYLPEVVNSMCCRVLLSARKEDMEDFKNGKMRSGSLQNITINLPRIAYESKDETNIFEILRARMELAKKALLLKREVITKRMAEGTLPLLTMDLDGEPYYRLNKIVHSIGMAGLNECVQYHTGKQLHESQDSLKLGLKLIQYMRDTALEFEKETGLRFAIDQSPAETTAARLAVIDYRRYGKKITKTLKGNLNKGIVYYTNSTHLNVSANIPLTERLQKEASFHPLCTGGVISHVFLGESYIDEKALLSFTRNLSKNTLLAYWDYNRDISVCKSCGQVSAGMQKKCPKCKGESFEYYSRITGYYSNVSAWHPAKQQELADRKRYTFGEPS